MSQRPVIFSPPVQITQQPNFASPNNGTSTRLRPLSRGIERLPPIAGIKGLVRICTMSDKSNFLHAIANARYKNYREGTRNGKSISREEWVQHLREDLAKYLDQPHPASGGKMTYYQSLSGGELAKTRKEFSLEAMRSLLKSDTKLDHMFLEYVADFMGIDIYILDLTNSTVLPLGIANLPMFYKGRTSIVIGFVQEHYETIGLETDSNVFPTSFRPDHPLIQVLRQALETT